MLGKNSHGIVDTAAAEEATCDGARLSCCELVLLVLLVITAAGGVTRTALVNLRRIMTDIVDIVVVVTNVGVVFLQASPFPRGMALI